MALEPTCSLGPTVRQNREDGSFGQIQLYDSAIQSIIFSLRVVSLHDLVYDRNGTIV
jgi:hypothetical protein